MSKYKIRENKSCLNCEKFVAERFCPHCGQANTEFRYSFTYLFKHFVSDLLHYDSSIWITAKLLLFSPAALSKKYMAGKHKSYVNPVKLYIFISFFAFFIPGILPEKSEGKEFVTIDLGSDTKKTTDTTDTNLAVENIQIQIDSLDKIKDLSPAKYYVAKFMIKAKASHSKDRQERIKEFILHNLPKVLFVYMPLFAFWLWLFNNKKKFLYFDSGIFTLHYFSFLLLSITILIILNTISDWLNLPDIISKIAGTAMFCYAIFYFFRANRLFYGDKRWIGNTKAFIIFWIDLILILVIFTLFAFLAIYMV